MEQINLPRGDTQIINITFWDGWKQVKPNFIDNGDKFVLEINDKYGKEVLVKESTYPNSKLNITHNESLELAEGTYYYVIRFQKSDNSIVDSWSSGELLVTEDRVKRAGNNKELRIHYDGVVEFRVEITDSGSDGTVYDDEEVRTLISNLQTKIDNLDNYDDTEVRNLISQLQANVDSWTDTVYDDTELRSLVEEISNRVDNDTIYDDTEIVNRVTELENRPDNDTVYDDTEIKNEILNLQKNEVNVVNTELETDETGIYIILEE